MRSTLALLDGSLDYAGLFPPAKLDMAPAVANFARYRAGPESWILARMVVPASRLKEFDAAAESLLPPVNGPGHDDAWPVSGLLPPAGDPDFERGVEAVGRFNERHAMAGAGSALIDTVEFKAASADEIDEAIETLDDEIFPYIEIDAKKDPRGLITSLADLAVGAKIRTGGLTPTDHPSPEEVARFVFACRAADVPLKATAGLHHPYRHEATSVGCRQHGFLNFFLGCCLVAEDRIGEAELAEMLADESPGSFSFREDSLAWRDRKVSVAEVRAARERFVHSFGSCSVDEPIGDLRAGGLLPAGEGVGR